MSKVTVTIYRVDGNEESREIDKDNLLKEMQEIVGGYIERVPSYLDKQKLLFVNEEGLIHGLPRNPFAPFLFVPPFVGNAVCINKSDFE